MSVEKVNKYKEQKANRKEIIAAEKKKAKAARVGLIVGGLLAAALLIGAIALTIVNQRKAYLASIPDYNATSMIIGDMAGVLAEETVAEETAAE